MAVDRNGARRHSNNPDNPNQNMCALRVAQALGVADNVRYLHVRKDCVRAARTAYTVRSRFSQVKGKSVGGARAKLSQITQKDGLNPVGYLVFVDRHVMLLDKDGQTRVDTDPRQRDRRKVRELYVVY